MACPPLYGIYMLEHVTCPLCHSPVRIARREDGSADHYEPIDQWDRNFVPNPISPILASYLNARRKGKKTVALVGTAWSSGPWAPFGEEGIDVWGMNELHAIPWYEENGATGWFQIHHRKVFTEEHEDIDHWGWLQEEHPFPIYMHRVYDDVPSSVKYPLREIQKELIGNIYRGEEKVENLFSSTLNYQVALALYQGYERIELFGVELIGSGEYGWQREAMAYWVSKAETMGLEVWMPEPCSLLVQPLYGYEQVRRGGTGEVTWGVNLEPPGA